MEREIIGILAIYPEKKLLVSITDVEEKKRMVPTHRKINISK